MKLYLDTCSLQRPLDNKTQIRIILEAEAVLAILALCESGEIVLVSSEVLMFEIKRNPNETRRRYALEALSKAHVFAVLNDGMEERARELVAAGIGPLDALHLASAEAVGADCLCTCDDRFLRRVQLIPDPKTRVTSPLEVIQEIGKW